MTVPLLPLRTCKSGTPSLLKSDTWICTGPLSAVASGVFEPQNVPLPRPRYTLIVLSCPLATARSEKPSWLKSVATSDTGFTTDEMVLMSEKLPVPSPAKISTMLSGLTPTARSSLPSSLKSETAIEVGTEVTLDPTLKVAPAVKPPAPLPSRI